VRHLGKVQRKTKTRGLSVDSTAQTFDAEGLLGGVAGLSCDEVGIWATCGDVIAWDAGLSWKLFSAGESRPFAKEL
jgi:hypothetical protein